VSLRCRHVFPLADAGSKTFSEQINLVGSPKCSSNYVARRLTIIIAGRFHFKGKHALQNLRITCFLELLFKFTHLI
jgi:hypothetical protein